MTTGIDRFFRSLDLFDDVVDRVAPDRWAAPSPCPGWSAAAVVGHVVTGLEMIETMLEQGTAVAPPSVDPSPGSGADPAEAWRARYRRTCAYRQYLDPDATISGPNGVLTVDTGLGQASLELLVHAWDLARAAEVPFAIPDDLAAPLIEALEPLDDVIRPSGMYGDRLPVPAAVSASQRLLAFVGRRSTSTADH